MEDTGLAEAPVAETPAATTEAPTSFIGTDGTLGEGWTGTLDESVRGEKSLQSFKTVSDLAKSYVTTKSMVGKNKIAIPTESSSDGEWTEYYRAGGRPDTVEDYGLAVPDGFPPDIAEQVFPVAKISKWQERFFKGGVSKKAAQQFIAEFANDMLADIQNQQQMEQLAVDELVSGLSQEWGASYDQKIHLGNMAIEEGTGGNQEFKSRIVAKIQKDPDLTRFASNLGAKFAEGKSPSYTAIPTPSDIQSQINDIEMNPLYLNGTHKQRMDLANRVMALRAKMNPQPANT